MSNSPLVSYTKLSPNHSGRRNHVIDTISIHCMAGNGSVETCGALFADPSRKASSNYGIGSDGRIALYVEEANRSWCTSNAANDHRAITIEVANNGGAPDWPVSDKAYAALLTKAGIKGYTSDGLSNDQLAANTAALKAADYGKDVKLVVAKLPAKALASAESFNTKSMDLIISSAFIGAKLASVRVGREIEL